MAEVEEKLSKAKQKDIAQKQTVEHIAALERAITRDGSWEVINGERIYQKEVIKDNEIPGHTILKVRTFEPGTNRIKQENNRMDTIHLFDNAKAFVQYYEPRYRAGHNGERIAEVRAEYDNQSKDFIPIIIDKDNNKYVGTQIADFWSKK